MEFLARNVKEENVKGMLVGMRNIINPDISDFLKKSSTESSVLGLAIDFVTYAAKTATEKKVESSGDCVTMDEDGGVMTWPFNTKIFAYYEGRQCELRVLVDDAVADLDEPMPELPEGWEKIG